MENLSLYSRTLTLICLSMLVTNMTHILPNNDDSAHEHDGITLLINAVFQHDIKKIESLLKSKTNVNESNNEGMTALLAASISGNECIAEVLLNHKAHADQKDRFGTTPIIVARRFLNAPLLQIMQKALKQQKTASRPVIKSNL